MGDWLIPVGIIILVFAGLFVIWYFLKPTFEEIEEALEKGENVWFD